MSLLIRVSRRFTRLLGRQRWIRFGLRDRIARLVENPDTTHASLFVQPFFGGLMWAIRATLLTGVRDILVLTRLKSLIYFVMP